jgi:regulator of RNase E activity RraA
MHSPIEPEVLTLLGQASTATITTQLFKRGLRNTFMAGLAPLNPTSTRFVAEAFTLRYIPAREDIDVVEAFNDYDHPQRKAIEAAAPGHVLVMDCRGQNRAASAGHILVARLAQRGVAGLVTDGALRDSHRIGKMDFPVFSAGVSAMTNLAQHHAVDMQVPIGCAGVPVFPGDIIVGDEEGVVCIPREYAATIAKPTAEQEELEEFLLRRVADGAPLRGTYPPDEQTLAEFRGGQPPSAPNVTATLEDR